MRNTQALLPPAVRRNLMPYLLGHALLREVVSDPTEVQALREMLKTPADDLPLPDPFEPILLAFWLGGFVISSGFVHDITAILDPSNWTPGRANHQDAATQEPWNTVRNRIDLKPRDRPRRR